MKPTRPGNSKYDGFANYIVFSEAGEEKSPVLLEPKKVYPIRIHNAALRCMFQSTVSVLISDNKDFEGCYLITPENPHKLDVVSQGPLFVKLYDPAIKKGELYYCFEVV